MSLLAGAIAYLWFNQNFIIVGLIFLAAAYTVVRTVNSAVRDTSHTITTIKRDRNSQDVVSQGQSMTILKGAKPGEYKAFYDHTRHTDVRIEQSAGPEDYIDGEAQDITDPAEDFMQQWRSNRSNNDETHS